MGFFRAGATVTFLAAAFFAGTLRAGGFTVTLVKGGFAADFALVRFAGTLPVDAFLTGEISEPQAHLARETGVAFLACGHHATECFGAPALASHVAERFALEHRFIEIANPA